MQNDPLVALFAAAIEGLFARGVTITPTSEGWLVKLADEAECATSTLGQTDKSYRRSW